MIGTESPFSVSNKCHVGICCGKLNNKFTICFNNHKENWELAGGLDRARLHVSMNHSEVCFLGFFFLEHWLYFDFTAFTGTTKRVGFIHKPEDQWPCCQTPSPTNQKLIKIRDWDLRLSQIWGDGPSDDSIAATPSLWHTHLQHDRSPSQPQSSWSKI